MAARAAPARGERERDNGRETKKVVETFIDQLLIHHWIAYVVATAARARALCFCSVDSPFFGQSICIVVDGRYVNQNFCGRFQCVNKLRTLLRSSLDTFAVLCAAFCAADNAPPRQTFASSGKNYSLRPG